MTANFEEVITALWVLVFVFVFWPHYTACRRLVPGPRIKPMSPALKGWSLNLWTSREIPVHTS